MVAMYLVLALLVTSISCSIPIDRIEFVSAPIFAVSFGQNVTVVGASQQSDTFLGVRNVAIDLIVNTNSAGVRVMSAFAGVGALICATGPGSLGVCKFNYTNIMQNLLDCGCGTNTLQFWIYLSLTAESLF
jgi:hypothetical protein